MGVELKSVKYPKEEAMNLYDSSVDDFYRKRLENGVWFFYEGFICN